MSKTNDGGPAFPASWHPEMGWSPRDTPPGMSLRDWFAGQALTGYVAAHSGPDVAVPEEKSAAINAYIYADAMLAVRNKQREP